MDTLISRQYNAGENRNTKTSNKFIKNILNF